MQDSTDNTITYKRILDRAKSDAREHMPDLPKVNTLDAWQAFIDEIEALDAHDIAYESSEWDWVIYHSRAMELCLAVPSSVLNKAEETYFEYELKPESFFGYTTQLAAIIVTSEVSQAVESLREELLELAQAQIDNEGW